MATAEVNARRGNYGIALVVCLIATFAAAAFGATYMPGAWYAGLTKPPLNPPNWIFGPVWTTLYFLMAVAATLVWGKVGFENAKGELSLFAVQLVLNGMWSMLFFGMQRPDLALVDIVALLAMIVATLVSFYRVTPLAGLLLVPYLMWVSFATYLNGAIWWLNR